MEIQANEVINLLLSLGVLIFILANYAKLKHLPAVRILLAGFCVLLAAEVLTNVEGFWPKDSPKNSFFNLLEHICYAGSALLIAFWCRTVFGRKRGAS